MVLGGGAASYGRGSPVMHRGCARGRSVDHLTSSVSWFVLRVYTVEYASFVGHRLWHVT